MCVALEIRVKWKEDKYGVRLTWELDKMPFFYSLCHLAQGTSRPVWMQKLHLQNEDSNSTFLTGSLWTLDIISVKGLAPCVPDPWEVVCTWTLQGGEGTQALENTCLIRSSLCCYGSHWSIDKYSLSLSQGVPLYFLADLKLGVAMWQARANKMNRRNMCYQEAFCHVLFIHLPSQPATSRQWLLSLPKSQIEENLGASPKHVAWMGNKTLL